LNVRFIGLLVFVSAAALWITLPFYGTILWAFIVALLFSPLDRLILGWLKGRKTASAAITVALVFVMVVLPLGLIAASLANEISVFVSASRNIRCSAALGWSIA
jgi:predicted PurR-regulated permease PerM